MKTTDIFLIMTNHSPEEIYAFFHISKKTFKMTTGNLYKQTENYFYQIQALSLTA